MRYQKFDCINGEHPWRSACPDGYVDYPVRIRRDGRVLYFNFELAKDLELIPPNHDHKMNKELENKLLETFSLQIINEYEQEHDVTYPAKDMKEGLFMATRYLQLQHKSRQGKTSGDGRSIWNGYIQTGRMCFDLSSRGTGATILSPGAQEIEGYVRSGDDSLGYASGMADVEEMLGSSIMSEIFYQQGLPTERSLVVIDFPDGSAIGVRTSPNLLRPAHIFRYLKSGEHKSLQMAYDYFLERQVSNGQWSLPARGTKKYQRSLEYIAAIYAKLAAVLEEEYIFNWLAWDGDNILANGSILDYGSIRQFAAKHNKYRYEDVDRYSTSLTEQKYWARWIVQEFIQAVDFMTTGKKKPFKEFENDPILTLFDEQFKSQAEQRMLRRIGFLPEHIECLMDHHREDVQDFRKLLNYFENIKTSRGIEQLPDGHTHNPVFLVRDILRELPQFLLEHRSRNLRMDPEHFCKTMAANYVTNKDMELTDSRRKKALDFQEQYLQLVCQCSDQSAEDVLEIIAQRSQVINHERRQTGDAIFWIVQEAIQFRQKMNRPDFQWVLDRFIESQVLVPGKWKPIEEGELKGSTWKARFLRSIVEQLDLYKQSI